MNERISIARLRWLDGEATKGPWARIKGADDASVAYVANPSRIALAFFATPVERMNSHLVAESRNALRPLLDVAEEARQVSGLRSGAWPELAAALDQFDFEGAW